MTKKDTAPTQEANTTILVSWIDVAPNTQIKVRVDLWQLLHPTYHRSNRIIRIKQVSYWEYTASLLTLRALAKGHQTRVSHTMREM